jgi:hypothetical protein
MNEIVWVTRVVIVLIAIGAALYVAQRQRSRLLQTHFGPEYANALAGYGHRRAAERALVDRAKRVDKLEIRPLLRARRDELRDHWQALQSQFVDSPAAAVDRAHRLLSDVMREQGYPAAKFDEEVELLSVHHPAAVQHYRAAHRLADARESGATATEDLRQAMIHYRALFDELLNLGANPTPRSKEDPREA